MEEIKEGEYLKEWHELTEHEEQCAACAFAASLKTKPDHALRLLNLGNPAIIFGEKLSYCRIAQKSLDVMKIIFNNYL